MSAISGNGAIKISNTLSLYKNKKTIGNNCQNQLLKNSGN